MLLTGKYNFRNYTVFGRLDTSNKTIANMLKDAGYKTCAAGKWQLGGGDASIHALGFDDYMVWEPGGQGKVIEERSRYKSPNIYKDGAFLPDSLTNGKYGDDMFTDYVENYIDSNKNQPFFIYYPICLVHYPFCPPPNNPDFAAWDPLLGLSDTKYFPSMVNYMDTKIGEIINKVRSAGIANNTLIIFVGDNGTDGKITSLFNGQPFRGGKSHTTEAGTHVPMFMYWEGTIMPGSRSDYLLDLTDLLPTLANVAHTSIPATYGTLDGTSFYPVLRGEYGPLRSWIYPVLRGEYGTPRSWIFCHYDPEQRNKEPKPALRWIQDTVYKLYDSSGSFYKYIDDLSEQYPIPDDSLTLQEQQVKENFEAVLATMHN
jgi:arylsulfatase A